MPVIKGFSAPGLPGADDEEAPKRSGVIQGFTPYAAPDIPQRNPNRWRNPLEVANDTVVTGVNAGAKVVKGISDMFYVDNPVSQGLQSFIDMGEETYSDVTKEARAELDKALDGSAGDAAKGIGKFIVTSPLQTAAEIAGGIGPIGRAVRGASALSTAMRLGPKASTGVGLATGAGLGGAAAGGDAASGAYQQVMANDRIPIEHREKLAREAARLASAPAFGLGALSGGTGLERVMAGGTRLGLKSGMRVGAKEFLTEGLEEGGTQLSGNAAAALYDSNDDVWRGVPGAAMYGGTLGFGGGAAVTHINNRAIQAELLRTANPSPDAGLSTSGAPLGINPGGQVPLRDWINQQTGVGSPLQGKARTTREADLAAAFNEPSGVRVAGPDGIERELTNLEAAQLAAGVTPEAASTDTSAAAAPKAPTIFSEDEQKLMEMGVRPTKKSLELLQAVKGANLDDGALVPVVTSMAENKWGQARKLLAAAIADKNKNAAAGVAPVNTVADTVTPTAPGVRLVRGQENVSNTLPTGDGTAGSVGVGSPDVSGSVGPAGYVATEPGAVGGSPATAGVSSEEANVLSSAPGEQAAPVVTRKKRIDFASPQQGAAFVAPEFTEPSGPAVQEDVPSDTPTEDQLAIAAATGNNQGLQAIAEEEAGLRVDDTLAGDQDAQNQALEAILRARFGETEEGQRQAAIAAAYLTAMRSAPKGSKGKVQQAVADQFGIKPVTVRKYGNTTELVAAGKKLGYTDAQVRTLLEVKDNTKAAAGESVDAKEDAPNIATALNQLGVETEEGDTGGFGLDDSRTWKQGQDGMGDMANATAEAKANAVTSLLDQKEQLEETIRQYLEEGNTEIAEKLQAELGKFDVLIAKALSTYESFLKGQTEKKTAAKEPAAEPAKSKTVVVRKAAKPAAAPVEAAAPIQTTAEKYAELTKGYPVAAFDELTPRQQDLIRDLATRGELNLAAVNRVVGEHTVSASRRPGISAADQSGNRFDADETDLDTLAANPGVRKVIGTFDKFGMANAFQAVKRWYTTKSPVGWDAIYTMIDGEPSVVISEDTLQDPATTYVAVAHEVGHAVEDLQGGGLYSGDPQFNLRIRNGEVVATDPDSAIAELLNHFQTQDDALTELLVYPLDRTDADNASLTPNRIREEVFAQVFAFASGEGGRNFLRDNLPRTAAFMEKVHAEVKATNYEQAGAQQSRQPGQVQGGQQAAPVSRPSRQASPQATERLNTYVPAALRPIPRIISTALKGVGRRGLNATIFTEDLLNRAADKGLTAAKRVDSINRERAALMGEIETEVERISQMYNRVPTAEQGTGDKSVNKFIYDVTREAKWYEQPSWRGDKVTVDSSMAARFAQLSPQSKALVRLIFEHGDKMLARKKQIVQESVNSEYDALIADANKRGDADKAASLENDKKAQMARFSTLFRLNENRPYSPLKRFGDWVVVAKSKEYLAAEKAGDSKRMRELQSKEDHYLVNFAESEVSADEMMRELQEQGSYGNVVYRQKDLTSAAFDQGGMMDAFMRIKKALDAQAEKVVLDNTATGADRKLAEQQARTAAKAREVVAQLYLSSLAENSARKSELKRRGVAGEIDMLRSFATQGRADATFLAAAKYGGQMQDTLNEMRKQVREGDNQNEKSELFNEIALRHEASMQPTDSEFANVATRLTSVWLLATSPSYYLQNLTQPFMMSLPVMAGDHNYAKVAAALTKAYGDLLPMHKDVKVGESFNFDKAPPELREMLKTLAKRQRIDIGINSELGRVRVGGGNTASAVVNRIDDALSNVSQKLEAVNRITTAVAAYRMQLAKTGDTKAALEYADKILGSTHGDYTRTNAPRAFNHPAGRVMLQFRKFQLIQGTLLVKLWNQSFQGATPAEKVAGRKALGYLLAHTGVMAGLTGLPGFAAIAWLLGALGVLGDDDEPKDLEYTLRQSIGDNDMANLILKGVPAMFGMDLSRKVGFTPDKLMPVGDISFGDRAAVEKAMAALMGGPAGGLALRAVDGIDLIQNGDYYKGLEQLTPTGFSNMLKAYRQATDGVTRRNGDVVVSPDEISFGESVMSALGITPTSQSNRMADAKIKREYDQKFQERAKRITNDYNAARRKGDIDAQADARDAWQKLQDTRAKVGYPRQPMSTLLRAPAQQAQRERNTVGGIQFDKNTRRFVNTLAED